MKICQNIINNNNNNNNLFFSMVYKFDNFCNNFDALFLLFNIESGFPTDHRKVYLPWQLVNRFMKYKFLYFR